MLLIQPLFFLFDQLHILAFKKERNISRYVKRIIVFKIEEGLIEKESPKDAHGPDTLFIWNNQNASIPIDH